MASSFADGSAQSLAYDWDGPLVTATTWSGEVAGEVARTYGNDLRVASRQAAGSPRVDFGYSDDGLLTTAGELGLSHHADHGLLESTTLGQTRTDYAYNSFGELEQFAASASGTDVFETSYTYDAAGRIDTLTETTGGTTRTYDYGYDARGRLVEARERSPQTGGSFQTIETYSYDATGSATGSSMPCAPRRAGRSPGPGHRS